jgi:hypothetical protein
MKARQATKLKMLLVIVILPIFFPSAFRSIAYYKSSFLRLPLKNDDINNYSIVCKAGIF